MIPPGTLSIAQLPSTIQLSSDLQANFSEMLRNSPTFRQQLARIIAAPRLIITAQIDPRLIDRTYRARSEIRRYNSGLIVVNMLFGPGTHQAEWIAHEFEHVIEQLEGIRFSSMAHRGRNGVWLSGDDMIETARAAKVGRAVLAEVTGKRSGQTSLSSRQAD